MCTYQQHRLEPLLSDTFLLEEVRNTTGDYDEDCVCERAFEYIDGNGPKANMKIEINNTFAVADVVFIIVNRTWCLRERFACIKF